jgi:hypothetical protein
MRGFHFYKKIIFLIVMALIILFIIIFPRPATNHELISLFPIEHYDQTITNWIKPSDQDYKQTLLTPIQQKMRLDELHTKYFGERSPWSPEYINQIFSKPASEDLQAIESGKANSFDNKNKTNEKIQYGVNFIPYTSEWIEQIKENMNLGQFSGKKYQPRYRGITLDNLQGRVLPSNDPAFYSSQIAGQGYPFDNLQAAMVWTGTPVYILGETRDQAWSLVQTPNFIAWVKSNGIGIADEKFINEWKLQAQLNLAAIIGTHIPIIDLQNAIYRFTGYIGMLFPATSDVSGVRIAIPVADANRNAEIHYAILSHQQAAIIPLLPTPQHFSELIQQLINRSYGWGGMYAHNDCSAELKNLFIPFGILLPAHSSTQVDPGSYLVKKVDLSQANIDQRLAYLAQYGHKFMTIVYVGGHVFLYLGNYDHLNLSKKKVILTYQNLWGLKPKNHDDAADSRIVIGKSVLLPLLKVYPEIPHADSQANKKYFELGYLDVTPDQTKQNQARQNQTKQNASKQNDTEQGMQIDLNSAASP